MAERKRIALLFVYDEKWIGGTYYVQNIVHALNTLDDSQKPELTICSNNENDYAYLVKETAYPYMQFFKLQPIKQLSLFQRAVNKVSSKLLKKEVFSHNYRESLLPNEYELVFPNPQNHHFDLIDNQFKANWIPDFQEINLPEYFSRTEIYYRKLHHLKTAIIADKVVFSSNDAQKDFNKSQNIRYCQEYVVPFAVTHPDYNDLEIENLQDKFRISSNFFYAPNQFWIHKNHKIIIEAIKILKENELNIQVIFSGKEQDYRNTGHITELKEMVTRYTLCDNIKFLGFIDRREQLCLMKHAKAIIQPSLFEGWSTVVEDAKAMNQFVIASDLGVHQEQLKDNALFFDPYKPEQLAKCIQKITGNEYSIAEHDYRENIFQFALNFMKLASDTDQN